MGGGGLGLRGEVVKVWSFGYRGFWFLGVGFSGLGLLVRAQGLRLRVLGFRLSGYAYTHVSKRDPKPDC